MKIKPFAVEEWMNAYETGARFNIAETCVDSVSLDQLFALTGTDLPRQLEVGFAGEQDDRTRLRLCLVEQTDGLQKVGGVGEALLVGDRVDNDKGGRPVDVTEQVGGVLWW